MSLPKTLSMNIINQLNAPPQTTALQKVFILIGLGVFVALAALTASLPLPILSNQPDSIPVAGPTTTNNAYTIDAGATAWMIVAAFFGILLTPAVSYLYANLYGRSTSFSVQVSLLAGSMIAVLWIVFTFSLTYAKTANGDQILGFPKYYYMFAHVGAEPVDEYAPNLPFSIFAIFELSFPILTAAIVIAALIDRVNVYGLMFFLFVWHICLYTPVAHITWNTRGFFKTNEIEDFSGGLVVHMTAGITAAAGHLFLDWIKAPKAEARRPADPENLVFGAVLVWFLWFGINAGKSYAASEVTTQSMVNTIGGVTTSILTNYFLDGLFGIDVTDVTVVNSILLGLVATTPSSGYVTVGGSMVISVITVLTVRILGRYLLKESVDDTPYSIATLHGLGGSIAFIFTALISYVFINPQGLNGLTYNEPKPIRHHVAAVLAMWICLFLSLLLGFAVTNLVVPLSKDRQSPKGDYAPTPLGPFGGSNPQPEPEQQPAAEEPVQNA